MAPFFVIRDFNDPYGIRTRVTAVKGRCLNRLTKGPSSKKMPGLPGIFLNIAAEGIEPPTLRV